MKKQVFNPYLPAWEYIPDGEPRVFGDRLYIFGSHDRFDGEHYCLNDYVCWSTPVTDLSDWRYEGVIYRKVQDPKHGTMSMFAPDVVCGTDGRYYLYYTLSGLNTVSIAVCDTPAGKYEFYGYATHPDGTLCGERADNADRSQFDPGVLVDDDGKVYLYTGFSHMKSMLDDMKRKGETPLPPCDGSTVAELEADMKTIKVPPKPLTPGWINSEGSGFEGFEFFEAPSMRVIDGTYYLIYSSIKSHELCYATSKYPDRDFTYRGVLHSNGDVFIDDIAAYNEAFVSKPETIGSNYWGNNHGSVVEVNGEFYIFGHRQTNAHEFSRQAIAEKLERDENGGFKQSEMTSCGLNGKPLEGTGTYSAGIACNLSSAQGVRKTNAAPVEVHPYITQDGPDYDPDTNTGQPPEQYICNLRNGSFAGFKYFDVKGLSKISIESKCSCDGSDSSCRSCGEITCEFISVEHGNVVSAVSIPAAASDSWKTYSADVSVPDGVYAIRFVFKGDGITDFKSFTLM
ncbi:MAG: family 43 glycosylhydrolase [Oscillospiraceae bacterium]|nr:family 43 glycosylhydrolase [Oscillospiraceae bacterium]